MKTTQTNKTGRKTQIGAALLGVSLLLSGPSWAGLQKYEEVEVEYGDPKWGNFATGSKISARDSADDTQHIGCSLKTHIGTSNVIVECKAEDKEGDVVSCETDKPQFVSVVQGMSDYGRILFSTHPQLVSGNECTFIFFSNDSSYLP